MNKADVVLNKALKTDQDAAIILEPVKQSLHFPSSSITVKLTPSLGFLLLSIGAMKSNQFHSIFSQLLVQRIAVICLVANQTLLREPIPGNVGGKSGTEGIARVYLSIGHRCA